MIEELDLITHVLQWRDDDRWRIVSKDQLDDERSGTFVPDGEDEWTVIETTGHRGGGSHYLWGYIADALPDRVVVNGTIDLTVKTIGRIWAVSSETEITEYTVSGAGWEQSVSFHRDYLPVEPHEPLLHDQPSIGWIRPAGADRRTRVASWPAATRHNVPDSPIGRLLAPVLDDLETTVPGLLRFGSFPSRGRDETGLIWLADSSGSGTGIDSDCADDGLDSIVTLAEAVQEAAVEALWGEGKSATWPVCPDHLATHPLSVRLVDEQAVWVCPASERVVARVGELGR